MTKNREIYDLEMRNAQRDKLEEIMPFWKKLSIEEKQILEANVREELFPKGTLIHKSQEECKGLISLLSGQLRVYVVSDEGREVTLYRIRSNETCVLSASCLLDSIAFDVLIEAVEDTKAAVIPSTVLHQVMQKNPYVELYLHKAATERFSDVMWTMQQILFMRADQRVARFLWDEMIQEKEMEIRMTHDEIARYIGSAREVVTKVLKYLAQEGVVALDRGKINILDKDKLSKFL